MPESGGGFEEQAIVRSSHHSLIHILLPVDNGTYLQPVKTPFRLLAGLNHPRKLDLHRTLHLLLTFSEHKVDRFGEGIHIMLEHIIECDHFTAVALIIVTQHIVAEIVSRHHVGQRSLVGDILHSQFCHIISVLNLYLSLIPYHIEGIHACLRVTESQLKLRGLEHISGMARRETEPHSAIHNILSKPYSNLSHTVLRGLFPQRIIVERTPHSRERREIVTVKVLAHDLL